MRKEEIVWNQEKNDFELKCEATGFHAFIDHAYDFLDHLSDRMSNKWERMSWGEIVLGNLRGLLVTCGALAFIAYIHHFMTNTEPLSHYEMLLKIGELGAALWTMLLGFYPTRKTLAVYPAFFIILALVFTPYVRNSWFPILLCSFFIVTIDPFQWFARWVRITAGLCAASQMILYHTYQAVIQSQFYDILSQIFAPLDRILPSWLILGFILLLVGSALCKLFVPIMKFFAVTMPHGFVRGAEAKQIYQQTRVRWKFLKARPPATADPIPGARKASPDEIRNRGRRNGA